MSEPPEKRPRLEGAADAEVDVAAETDAPDDLRPRLGVEPQFLPCDRSLNVNPSDWGFLSSLSESGFQQLIASARASVGVKAGRYVFEVRVVERSYSASWDNAKGHVWGRHQLRVGFAHRSAGSTVAPGVGCQESILFDAEGFIRVAGALAPGNKKPVPLTSGSTLAVVVDLDSASPQANTFSIFLNGVRHLPSVKLPTTLTGEALYPSVAFRNLVLHVNFGELAAPLPFTCRSLHDAAKDDVMVTQPVPKLDGKRREVVFPIFIPDEGSFEWLQYFLQSNPSFTELSQRKLAAWAEASDLKLQWNAQRPSSGDRPDVSYGVGSVPLDLVSVKRVLASNMPLLDRDVVVMEIQDNLCKGERVKALQHFHRQHFRRVAKVMMARPPEAFLKILRDLVIAERQEAVDKEWANKKVREKILKARQAAGASESKAAADEQEKPEEPEEPESGPPKVELSSEDLEALFPRRKSMQPDLTPAALAEGISDFCLPEEDEGFDAIEYEWAEKDVAKDYLAKWLRSRRLITRVEGLQPMPWFSSRFLDFAKEARQWRRHQEEWKALQKKKSASAESEPALSCLSNEDRRQRLDIFAVEDISDIGDGEPLYARFELEDWAFLLLRYELHLLAHGFTKSCKDPSRPGIHPENIPFYYEIFFKRKLIPGCYGVQTIQALVDLVRDSVVIGAVSEVLESHLPDDLESIAIFGKLTEEVRRDRQCRIDRGDAAAAVQVKGTAVAQAMALAPALQVPASTPITLQVAPASPAIRPTLQALSSATIKPVIRGVLQLNKPRTPGYVGAVHGGCTGQAHESWKAFGP